MGCAGATLEAFIRRCPTYAGKLPPQAIQHSTVKKNVATRPSFAAWAVAALEQATRGLSEGLERAPESHAEELQGCYEAEMGAGAGQGRGAHRLLALEAVAAVVWPVVEAAVVVDRLAYLQQHSGVAAALLPLFDPVASPRNWVLLATQQQQGTGSTSSVHSQ